MSNNARQIALNIRRRISELYSVCGMIKAAADTWVLDDDDTLLPPDGVIKTALEAYESMKITPLRLFEEITEIKAGTGEPLPELPPVPLNINTEWAEILNKPSVFPSEWDLIANKPTVSAADWNTLLNKPSVFPSDPHINQRIFLTFKFPGALTVGQYALDGLFYYLSTGARLISAHLFCPDPGGAGSIRIGIYSQITSNGTGWDACTVTPSPMVQIAGSQAEIGYSIINMANATPPTFSTPASCGSNLLFAGGTMFKAVIEEIAPGSSDAVLSLEFYADCEDFWAYEEFV